MDNEASTESPRRRRRWLLLLLLLLLLFGCLCVYTVRPFRKVAASQDEFIPASLHSVDEANYSADPPSLIVPAIGLDIIRDIILDEESGNDLPARLETITAVFQTPLSQGTLEPTLTSTARPTKVPSPTPTLTRTIAPTQQAVSSPLPTNTATYLPTPTAT